MSKIKLHIWLEVDAGLDLEVTPEQFDRLHNAGTLEEARLVELEILPETITIPRDKMEIGGYSWE